MPEVLLLDTHALLWWQAESRRLSRRALRAIEDARMLLVSPITCWEVAVLVEAARVQLDRPTATWCNDLFAQDGIDAAELTPTVAVAAARLPAFHGDPADRMIYATAAGLGIPLVTKDGRLRDYAKAHAGASTIW